MTEGYNGKSSFTIEKNKEGCQGKICPWETTKFHEHQDQIEVQKVGNSEEPKRSR
jgi:hypothetical protein